MNNFGIVPVDKSMTIVIKCINDIHEKTWDFNST